MSVGDRNGNLSRGGSSCGTCSLTTNDRAACDAECRDADLGEASWVISDSGHILTLTLHVVDTPTHAHTHTHYNPDGFYKAPGRPWPCLPDRLVFNYVNGCPAQIEPFTWNHTFTHLHTPPSHGHHREHTRKNTLCYAKCYNQCSH